VDFSFRGVVEVRWPLPKPLYMEPGDVIQCYLDRSNQLNLAAPYVTNNFNVTYVGRALAPGKKPPPCKYVPWVANYIHQTADDAVGVPLSSNAGETYRNPFTIPLHVHRLTQHTYRAIDSTSQYEETQANRSLLVSGLQGLNVESSYAQIKMEDSLGYAIVKDFTAIGEVLDMARQAWTFSRPIGPREQFNVDFLSSDFPVTGYRYDTLLAMVSHREEAI
jgi:hypothetical protein